MSPTARLPRFGRVLFGTAWTDKSPTLCARVSSAKPATLAPGAPADYPTPDEPFPIIHIDFFFCPSIERAGQTYDAVMIVIDRLTKFLHLLP